TAANQIVINAGLASTAGLKVGDQVGVLTVHAAKKTFALVGIFEYSGGRGSLGGEQTVAFTMPVAQQLMLGGPDRYSSIAVRAAAVGLLAGVGTGFGLAYLFGHLGGANLQLAGVGVPLSAVIAAFGVGITITVLAATLPALRAARVAPVEALRESATDD